MTVAAPAILFNDHHPSAFNGGEELVLRQILLGLAGRGRRCLLAYHEAGDLVAEYKAAGVECRRIDMSPVRLRHPLRFAASIAEQVIWARRIGVRVLHCNSINRAAHAAAIKAFGRFPIVCHLHNPPPHYLSRQYKWGLRRFDRLVAVSARTAEEWCKTLDAPQELIAVLYNPVDTGRFKPDPAARASARHELGIADDCVVLGYCGRLTREKGVDVLLRAAARLAADHPAIRLLVLGSDAQNVSLHGERLVPQMKALAGQLGIADRISFMGARRDVERWYNAMDVLVAPSIYSEPFGLVIAEALACGRPAVASRVGGIPEILSGPLDELLVSPGDDEALAATLRRLIDDPQRRAEIGQLGRESVTKRFGLANYLDRFEQVLREVAH